MVEESWRSGAQLFGNYQKWVCPTWDFMYDIESQSGGEPAYQDESASLISDTQTIYAV
jgi:hypothetical protein